MVKTIIGGGAFKAGGGQKWAVRVRASVGVGGMGVCECWDGQNGCVLDWAPLPIQLFFCCFKCVHKNILNGKKITNITK